MSRAASAAVPERGVPGRRPAGTVRARPQRHRVRPASSEAVLEHYLKSIDPEVAASFTEVQREAIKLMLGVRSVAKHAVEVRRSVPLGRRRFYLVFLMGAERRALARLHGEGLAGHPLRAIAWLTAGALALGLLIGALTLTGL